MMATPFRDRIIPWYFVAFFAVIFLVDGVMVTLALKSYGGTVTEHPYEKGIAYNEVVQAEARQEKLGWQGEIEFTGGRLVFTLKDRKNGPVPLDAVTARFHRPTQAGMDFSLPLRSSAPGVWEAEVVPPLPGLWKVRVHARQKDHRYQQARRIIVE